MCMNKIWISLSKIKYYIRVVFAYRTRTNRNHGLSFNGYMKTARRLLEEDRIVEYTEFMEQYPEYASLEREYLEKYVILEESVEETESGKILRKKSINRMNSMHTGGDYGDTRDTGKVKEGRTDP